MAHLLVIDDEQSICWGLSKLAQAIGHDVTVAGSAEEGLDAARKRRPDAVILDVRLPGMDGLAAMSHFHALLGALPIIVITAYGDLDTAVESVHKGAFDYLVKPFDLSAAQRAIERALDPRSTAPHREDTQKVVSLEGQIVGRSRPMQELFKQIALVAASDACVLLSGESGTGKELVTRAIHRHSPRSKGPFVPVNVASLSSSLAESELFGHVQGAFTGADQSRKGLLEQANGGTVFLDEVSDIPLALQVKLLRVLEHGEILPVGASQPVRSDFRVVSASHQDLRQRVAEGKFRHDLYYRLVAFEITLPPLRNRREDIETLANHFLGVRRARGLKSQTCLSPDALAELKKRRWHGNVRELLNAIDYAMIMARGGRIAPEHLPSVVSDSIGSHTTLEEGVTASVRRWAEAHLEDSTHRDTLHNRLLRLVEPPLVEATLRKCGGQRAAASARLGVHRMTLRKKIEQFGIDI